MYSFTLGIVFCCQASILQFKECLQYGAVGALINGYDSSNTGGDFNYYITKDRDVEVIKLHKMIPQVVFNNGVGV